MNSWHRVHFYLHLAAILVVLGLAAGLRWHQPGLVEFKYDEAHILGMAQQIASGCFWPVFSGGTSIGVQRSAFDAYLLALALLPTQGSPQAVVIWLGMLGVLAVALTYLLGRMIEGRWLGLLAALYMAANPWLVFYDRKFWAHIQVVFSVLLLILAWKVVIDDDKRANFWFPIVASLQLLTHVLAVVQGLSWLAAILLAPRRWLRRQTLWGSMIGLIIMSPYLGKLVVHLLSTRDRSDAIFGNNLAPAASLPSLSSRLTLAWQLLSGDRIFELAGIGVPETRWDVMLQWGRWLVLGLMFLGLLRGILWLQDAQKRPKSLLLVAWGLGPVLALSFGPLHVYLQYWTVLLPLPAIFFALGATWPISLTQIKRRADDAQREWGNLLAKGFVIIVVLALFSLWPVAYISVLDRIKAGAGLQTFGIPLRQWQEATTEVVKWASELGLEQVKIPITDPVPEVSSTAAAASDLLPANVRPRFFYPRDGTPALLLHATEPSIYLVDTPAMEPLLKKLGKEIWHDQGKSPLRLYLLPSAEMIDIPVTTLSESKVFDIGIALQAYAFPQPWPEDKPNLATLVWHVQQPAPDVAGLDFTAFNHILREDDRERVAQADGLALLSQDWQLDDVLYQGYWIVIPESGHYEWLVGLYSRSDGDRAHLTDGSDAVHLPLTVTSP